MSSTEQRQSETVQELQTRVESLLKSFREKDEECSSAQNQLSAANSAMTNLESAKAKAKSEIHSLLMRVQDSERWMKLIKETLERQGIDTADESFPKTWSRLDGLLKAKTARCTSGNSPPQGAASGRGIDVPVDVPANAAMALTPRRSHGSPSESYFQTELIYRTQSIQSTYSSPGKRASRPGAGCGIMSSIPESQATASIVPFSSVQKELSPALSLSQNEDPSEIANMFMFTPDNKGATAEVCDFSQKTQSDVACQKEGAKADLERERQFSQAENMAEERTDIAGGNNHGIKRKSVSFETEIPASSGIRPENSEPRDNAQESVCEEPANDRTVARLNQRTYGRSQHPVATNNTGEGSRKDHRRSSQYEENPSTQPASSHNIPGKRAKVSNNPHTRPQRRTRRSSDYFETRTSPTGLASGSSRHSSANGQHSNKSWVARGPRRGRRTRGRIPARWRDLC